MATAEHSFQDTLALLRDLLKRDLDKGMRDDPLTMRISAQIDQLDPPKKEHEHGPTEKVQKARAQEEGGGGKGGEEKGKGRAVAHKKED